MELNIDTCRPPTGPASRPCISIDRHRVLFGASAVRKLLIKEADRISFRLKDGVLLMQFDTEKGFDLRKKTDTAYCIYSTELANKLKEIAGKKIHIGEFRNGSYVLSPY